MQKPSIYSRYRH